MDVINYIRPKMKKILFATIFLFCCLYMLSAQKPALIKDILEEHVALKVDKMQQLIKFGEEQRAQLQKLELNFLLDVQKAETCACCNVQKKVEKLKIKREQDLQKILTRDQFIKYDAIENNRIKKGPLRSEEVH